MMYTSGSGRRKAARFPVLRLILLLQLVPAPVAGFAAIAEPFARLVGRGHAKQRDQVARRLLLPENGVSVDVLLREDSLLEPVALRPRRDALLARKEVLLVI